MSLAMGNKLFIDKSVSVAVIYNIYIYIKLVSTQHASIFFFLFININIYKQYICLGWRVKKRVGSGSSCLRFLFVATLLLTCRLFISLHFTD